MTPDALSRLRAGLDRDDALARAALDFPYDRPEDAPWIRMQWHVRRGIAATSDEHFVRHDPARVLRQVAAIREVVAECETLIHRAALVAEDSPAAEAILEALAGIYPTETGDPS